MRVKIIASIVAALALYFLGCAADTGLEQELTSSGPVISIAVDDNAKLEYLQNVKDSMKSYQQVVLDIKYYHKRHHFKELAKEIDKYLDGYVADIVIKPDSGNSIEARMEIAKIHLLVISLYFDMDYNIKALKYLESFHERYHNDTYLLEKTLDPADIGYSSLGRGMKMLQARASSGLVPILHGKMYPWKKSRGKIDPEGNPNM